jgi:hypothetical protein
VNDDADDGGPQNPAMKKVSILKYFQNVTVGIFLRFSSLYRLVHVWVEHLARRFDALQAVP